MISAYKNCLRIPELKKRLLFTFGIIALCRLASMIPCPGVNPAGLKAVFSANKGIAVGSGVARILQVVLAELLGRGHIERPGIHVGDFPNRVVEDLSAGMGGEKPVIGRNLQVADERVLQFADDGMGLMVLYRSAKMQLSVLTWRATVQGVANSWTRLRDKVPLVL